MNKDTFNKALHLLPTVNAVVEHNLDKLKQNGQQVAEIKAVHSGPRLTVPLQKIQEDFW